jgi:hypothetical protein
MDVAPVVFGSGKRYFGSVDAQHLLVDPDVVIQGNRVLHVALSGAPMTDPSGYAKTLALPAGFDGPGLRIALVTMCAGSLRKAA